MTTSINKGLYTWMLVLFYLLFLVAFIYYVMPWLHSNYGLPPHPFKIFDTGSYWHWLFEAVIFMPIIEEIAFRSLLLKNPKWVLPALICFTYLIILRWIFSYCPIRLNSLIYFGLITITFTMFYMRNYPLFMNLHRVIIKNRLSSLILLGVIFGLGHFDMIQFINEGSPALILMTLPQVVFGIVAGLIVIRWESILPTILLHMLNNGFIFLLYTIAKQYSENNG